MYNMKLNLDSYYIDKIIQFFNSQNIYNVNLLDMLHYLC